ncbi:MAG: hypothetical protein ACKO1O_10675 [Erythrobacter sp.]
MSIVSVYGFANESAAQTFFNKAKKSREADAIFLNTQANIQYSRELQDFQGIESSLVFTVITFSPGTPIQLDSGSRVEAEPEE